MSRIVVARHGNTFEAGETPRRIGSATDLPLTAAGRAQATALGRHLTEAGYRFTTILAGPLGRTRETAGLIAAALAGTPAIAEAWWLGEIDHGPDENRPEPIVAARIGAAALARWDAAGVVPDGWIAEADRRIAAWRGWLTARTDADGDALLVTSNGAARFALRADPALAAGLSHWKLRTGAYGLFAPAADGRLARAAWDVRP